MYNLDGSIFSLLPLYGDGDMYVEVTGLDLNANPGMVIDAGGFLQVTELDLGANFQNIGEVYESFVRKKYQSQSEVI